MNKEESLALFAQGRKAWNAWAAEMQAQREALAAAGTWTTDRDATRDWHLVAAARFSEHTFEDFADFTGFVFPGDAGFSEATFSGDAWFSEAIFSGRAWFNEATFSGEAWFNEATFSGDAWFSKATFSGDAWFDEATFLGDAWITEATFSVNAWFIEATFSGDAWFDAATFSVDARFSEATFSGNAGFSEATFSGDAWFTEATFSGDARFIQAVFQGFTAFDGATLKETAFRAIEGRSAFSLAGTTFLAVPDFIQAHFAEAPRLDDLRIEPRRVWPPTLAGVKAHFKGDPGLSARWRALKRLAVQGHDHEREQAFFKGELKSRRWSMDKPWNAAFWFGLLYQWLSDFGRSMVRPLLWWVAGVLGFACLYLGQHPALVGTSLSGFDWAIRRVTALAGSEAPPLSCMAGPGEPWSAALGLSLRKGLLFVGLDSTDKLNQIYGCLYGIYTDKTVVPDQLPDAFSPVIPDGIAFLGLLQLLYSAVVIFLFLLAVRNHFRIK